MGNLVGARAVLGVIPICQRTGQEYALGLKLLAPVLIGEDPLALDALNATMDLNLPGHPYVKSAIDMACWDILGKVAGLPLYKLLGGTCPTPVAFEQFNLNRNAFRNDCID